MPDLAARRPELLVPTEGLGDVVSVLLGVRTVEFWRGDQTEPNPPLQRHPLQSLPSVQK